VAGCIVPHQDNYEVRLDSALTEGIDPHLELVLDLEADGLAIYYRGTHAPR
jgi:hypothetical protein